MKLFGRGDTPERPASCTSEEYERLMKTLGRLDAMVESLETKWRLWKTEGDRLLARLERREQRARQKAENGDALHEEVPLSDVERLILARRGKNAVSG